MDKIELIIDDFGVSLGKKSERLVIKDKKQVVNEIPFYDLAEISVCSSGVSISTDLIWECSQRGIPINFLHYTGEPYANLMAPGLQGTVKTRREQLLAYEDRRGVELAKAFSTGKLRNQQVFIKYFSKYRKDKDRDLYDAGSEVIDAISKYIKEIESIAAEKIDEVRGQILAYEGAGSKAYWSIFGQLLPKEIQFPGRVTQGATDLVNSLLNYGYGILYSKIWSAVTRAGLEPYAGFIHVDRPGKPSLVFDCIEEFRQSVVDRAVLAALNKGVKFEVGEEGLTLATRKELAAKVMERLSSTEKYEGHKHKMQTIIQRQSRHLAVAIRGEREYTPFVCGW